MTNIEPPDAVNIIKYCPQSLADHWMQKAHERQAEIDRLTLELAECKKDAERFNWMVANSAWVRKTVESGYDMNDFPIATKRHSFIEIRVLDDADLSCKATTISAIDAAMEATK